MAALGLRAIEESPPAAFGKEPRLGEEILARIGHTPLLQLRRVTAGLSPDVGVYAKAEWFNPGGSVKDRAAHSMILDGERRGLLTPEKVLIDSTSGNTGIAYAMIGAVKGYRVKLVTPSSVSEERKAIISAYGADIVYSDPLQGSDGAILLCRQIIARDPDRYFKPDQYNNPANPEAHYQSTGAEIWHQTRGAVTHFVAGLGTSGTVMGTGRRLREYNAKVRIIGVEPDHPMHGLEGLKHMETALIPGIYDEASLDERIAVDTEVAYAMAERLAREEGLFVGFSSGAAMVAALQVAARLTSGVVVTLFPDGGDRYLSKLR